MAPAPSAASASAKPRLPPKASAAAPAARVTRLRAAKEGTTSPAVGPAKPGGFLAKGKEGLRKVSDKIAQKEKEKEATATRPKPIPPEHDSYSESLQAYLRIRPSPADADPNAAARPYLEIQSDKDVLMRAPADSGRHHLAKPPHIFSFNRVFPPTTPQGVFFTTTTMPLVEKLLHGENGLLFAYGVSNSGKSYTIQGGAVCTPMDRGVLPRSIDVVFNSISGLESKANLKPQGLADVVLSHDFEAPLHLADPLAELEPRIDDAVKVDRNFSYAVFVSYAEVYNEKIFDLLDSVLPTATSGPSSSKRASRLPLNALPRASNAFPLSGAFNSSINLAAMANGGGGVLKRQGLTLKNDPEGNGKYISGLKEVRVRTREEALAVFRSGQSARQVFGTIANRESSRSHGIFTIKVVRVHNGAPEDPDSAQVSRLAIVDLAGSERTRNTHTTGDRLKEAGNINKSLMVLGQCLEVLRANQQKMATPTVTGQKKKLAVVPFRHSKLTEIFQNFFVGDGRAVIIVNVNPYDTGFDENSHVMRFSAIAREIQTTASNKVGFPLLKRQISTQFNALKHAVSGPMKIKVVVPVLPKEDEHKAGSSKVKVTSERESQGFVMVEEELEVVEEDGESESEDESDPLVDYLFDQLKEMKTRLYESEMRNATIEAEVREEVAREMHESLQRMNEDFGRRLTEQVAANELKTDRKIDIVTRTMTPAVSRIANFRGTPNSEAISEYESPAGSAMEFETDADVTMDESFESAIDASLMTSGDDSMVSTESDPFLVRATTLIPQVIVTRDSVATVKHGSSPSRDSVTETEGEDSSRANITLNSEVDDDDEAALRPVEEVESSEEEELTDSEEDTDEEEETEQEEVDESEDEEVEADEEELDSDESAFTLSDQEDDSSSEDSSPVRRASTNRRKTGSPTKSRTPVKPRTPAKVQPKTPASTKKQRRISASTAASAGHSPIVHTPGPLSERVGQLQLDSDDDDEDEAPIKTTTKKKRTLGKKIVTEDEMNHADLKISGADVRRLVRGGN